MLPWNGASFLVLEGDENSWLKANCIKDGVVVDFSSNEKAKQCLAGEEFLLEGCDSENVLCSLIAELWKKGDEFIVGQLRVAEICETEKMWIHYEGRL